MPWRNLIRWVALVCGLAIMLWRAPVAIRDFRDWREAAISDPSAAELYETDFWFETAGMVIALGLGLVFFYGLKRKEKLVGGAGGE
jgi:hypothetical protein